MIDSLGGGGEEGDQKQKLEATKAKTEKKLEKKINRFLGIKKTSIIEKPSAISGQLADKLATPFSKNKIK